MDRRPPPSGMTLSQALKALVAKERRDLRGISKIPPDQRDRRSAYRRKVLKPITDWKPGGPRK